MFEGAVNVLDYVMEDYMVLANYVAGFEGGEVAASNSPLSAKYAGLLMDYSTVNGSGRIVEASKPSPDSPAESTGEDTGEDTGTVTDEIGSETESETAKDPSPSTGVIVAITMCAVVLVGSICVICVITVKKKKN